MPLSRVIGFVRSWAEFIADLEPGSRAVVFPGPPAPFGVVICYEGIFPELCSPVREAMARALMVNMTNDAMVRPHERPATSTSRCTRSGPSSTASRVVRAANTGISAFITPSGADRRAT